MERVVRGGPPAPGEYKWWVKGELPGSAQSLVVLDDGADHLKVRLRLGQLRRHHPHLLKQLWAALLELTSHVNEVERRAERRQLGPEHLPSEACGH